MVTRLLADLNNGPPTIASAKLNQGQRIFSSSSSRSHC